MSSDQTGYDQHENSSCHKLYITLTVVGRWEDHCGVWWRVYVGPSKTTVGYHMMSLYDKIFKKNLRSVDKWGNHMVGKIHMKTFARGGKISVLSLFPRPNHTHLDTGNPLARGWIS